MSLLYGSAVLAIFTTMPAGGAGITGWPLAGVFVGSWAAIAGLALWRELR